MKALTLHQPWASLIAVGVKTIETRSWATKYRGPLAIHAGKHFELLHADLSPEASAGLWKSGSRMLIEPHEGNDETWSHGNPFHPCPLGAIVATCTLVDVVPMVDSTGCKNATKHLCIVNESMLLHSPLDEPWPDGTTERIVSDQLPYGDFTPGRYAWLLEDVKATTERCPACWGRCSLAPEPICGDSVHRHYGDCKLYVGRRRCSTCDGKGTCVPVPAKGRQGLWEWAA